MTDESRTLSGANEQSTEEALDEQIVAYLDGELDREAATQVERRLAEDPAYRARLTKLQQAWDLLDNLGRTEADDDFAHSTVAMVAVKAEGDTVDAVEVARRRRNLVWAGMAALALVAAITAFLVVDRSLNSENRALVRDLPVIERIDQYTNIDSVEFLQRLQKEGLFAAEVEDGG
jgi:anti-sigma factor RsiW